MEHDRTPAPPKPPPTPAPTGVERLRARALDSAAALQERRASTPWLDAPWSTAERERELGGGLIAGGLAFRFFLWLLPLGLVVAALTGLWYSSDPDGLDHASDRFGLSAAVVRAISRAVAESKHGSVYLLVVGGLFLAYFTLGAVRALRLASSLAWSLKPRRVARPLHAILLFNGVFIGSILLGATLSWARAQLGGLGIPLVLASFAVSTAIAAAALRLLPNRDDRFAAHLPGALVVALGQQALHLAVIWYFAPKLGRSSDLYGSLGAAAVILVWLYASSRLLTGAMFFNAVLAERRAERRPRRARERGVAG